MRIVLRKYLRDLRVVVNPRGQRRRAKPGNRNGALGTLLSVGNP